MVTEKEIHLRDYLRVIQKRRYTVLTFFILTLLITIIATFATRQAPQYQASTQAVIEKNLTYSLTGMHYTSYGGYDPEFLETQIQIIKGEGVAAKVMASIGRDRIHEVFFPQQNQLKPSTLTAVKSWINQQLQAARELIAGDSATPTPNPMLAEGEIEPGLSKEDLVKAIIRGGISVEPVEGTRVVAISYVSPNPVLSRRIANSVAQAYIEELLDMHMESSGQSIKWMRNKAEEQREKLEEAEQLLHEYKKKHNIVTIEDRLAILPERLAELSEKMTQAETRRKELESIYSQVKDKPDNALETLSVIATSVAIDEINKKILLAEQKIAELSKKYGPKHPRMITATNELNGLRRKKHQELKNAVERVKNEYLLAQSQEAQFSEMLKQTKYDAEVLNEKSIQLGILKRQVETNQYLYDALIKRMKEKDLTEKNQLVNVWVIEKATTPELPLPGKGRRNILLALILGLFGGIGLAFFLEYLDNRIKAPEDIEEKYSLPVLGVINLLKSKKETVIDTIRADKIGATSEGFKSLRTSVLLSRADKPPQVLLVTSTSPSEGKSTISSSLALTMARADMKTLLIDADMRRPSLHKYFGVENVGGLSSYLSGNAAKKQLSAGEIENLHIVTSGDVPPNPSELLSSEKIGRLIREQRQSYDIIIIDSPPLSVTDPILLSRLVDGVLLVAAAGETRYEMLDKGIKKLEDVSAPISGLVLNRFEAKSSGYYYHYGDYYYHATDAGK